VLPSVAPAAAPYAPPAPAPPPRLFDSFLMAGFECSTHVRRDGTRLDLVALSGHDRHAAADYARCRALGIRTARDGVRWHLGESPDGRIAVAHEVERVRAARDAGVQVIWDLWHYGTPDHLDVLAADFPSRLARWARAFAELVAGETDAVPLYTPVNEISFVAWGGGDVGYLNPFRRGRGAHLKRQLARAAIEVTEAVWAVDGRARVCHVDPVIHVSAAATGRRTPRPRGVPAVDVRGVGPDRRAPGAVARRHRSGTWTWWGELLPAEPVGPRGARTSPPGDPGWRPLDLILAEVHARYGRPVFVAETGCEFEHRAGVAPGHRGRRAPRARRGRAGGGAVLVPDPQPPRAGTTTGTSSAGSGTTRTRTAGARRTTPLLAEWTRQRALLPS
jgi:hypothetical protein